MRRTIRITVEGVGGCGKTIILMAIAKTLEKLLGEHVIIDVPDVTPDALKDYGNTFTEQLLSMKDKLRVVLQKRSLNYWVDQDLPD